MMTMKEDRSDMKHNPYLKLMASHGHGVDIVHVLDKNYYVTGRLHCIYISLTQLLLDNSQLTFIVSWL